MTCIIGIEHAGGVTIGGDSAGLSGWSKTIRADEKVFTVGDYVMGFTTSFRMGQLLRYHLQVPGPDDWDVDKYIATTFIDAVRDTLKEGGWASTDNGQEKGGDFLVGIAGRLYTIYSDYQFARASKGYAAIGCGTDIALGSLHTSAQQDKVLMAHGIAPTSPERRAKLALKAAVALSGGCAPPFTIINHA